MNKKIKLGILGGGGDSFIGTLHRVASIMFDRFELVGGVFNAEVTISRQFAEELGIGTDKVYRDVDHLIEQELKLPKEERIQVVSILTPNFLHFPMAKKLLENGFHVICEKPMTTSYEEALILEETLKKAKTIFAVTYTYTGYPMVRQMKKMIAGGEIGEIQKIDVQYYQGWINPIIHDQEQRKTTWRLDPDKGGISCCIGDIGTHAFNIVEYVSGMQVSQLLSDLGYVYSDNKMDVDATVLLRFSQNVKGVLRTSQIATGEENNLTLKIYGKTGGLKWEQENPNYLYKMEEGEPLKVYKPGHSYNSAIALDGTKLPPGHPEGIFDSMGNIYKGVARAIDGQDYHSGEFPTMRDGVRGMNFIEKVVDSHAKGNVWVKLDK